MEKVLLAKSLASQLVSCVDCSNRVQIKEDLPVLLEAIEPEHRPVVYGFYIAELLDRNESGLGKKPPIGKIYKVFFPKAEMHN